MIPHVSILIPTYNGKRYLAQAIQSVLCQTRDDYEILIFDDASEDGTLELARSFQDPRVRIFSRDKNIGLFPNLNTLIQRSSAPLIRFLCQDDILEPNCLEEEIKFFNAHPEIGMSMAKFFMIDGGGRILDKTELNDLPDSSPPHLAAQFFFYYGCIASNLSTVCVRRECLADRSFDESFRVSGDYEMWVYVTQKKHLGVIHQHLVRIRHHPNQLSRQFNSAVFFILEDRKIRQRLLSVLPKPIHRRAFFYVLMRQNVLETHLIIRTFLRGRGRDFGTLMREKANLWLFLAGIIGWFLTVDNRLYKPKPKFFYP